MLSDIDSSDESDSVGIQINKDYAERYEKNKRFQELQKNKELLSDSEEDSETSESEDDDAVALSTSLDLEIMNTIKMIRSKDPKIYDKSTAFYTKSEDEGSVDSSDDENGSAKVSKKKKTYKDVLREQLLEDQNDSGSDDGQPARVDHASKSKSALLYDKEQEQIRNSFLSSIGDQHDRNESDSSDDEVLHVKQKDPAAVAREEEELRRTIDEVAQMQREVPHTSAEDESFLARYMKDKQWIDHTATSLREMRADARNGGRVMTVAEEDRLLDLEEDERELEEVDRFESKYNFRFEELQDQGRVVGADRASMEVVGHARTVEGSLRRVDDTRKKQRDARKERKEKEKRQKEAELRRLKNLKRQELEDRLREVERAGGAGVEGLDSSLLDEDWDPEKYEREMAAKFGDDYYQCAEDDFAPAAEDRDMVEGEYGEDGDYDYDYEEEERGEGEEYDEEGEEGAHRGVEGGREDGTRRNELYELDYEDIVAGMPCRFKYRQVPVEDFGLTVDDILEADDSELNKFVSLKSILAYDVKQSSGAIASDRQLQQKRKLERKRKRLKQQLEERRKLKESEEIVETTSTSANGQEAQSASAEDIADERAEDDEPAGEGSTGKKKRKRKKKKGVHVTAADEDTASNTLHVMAAVTPSPIPVDKPATSDASHNSTKIDSKKSKSRKKDKSENSAASSKKKRRLELYT